MEDFLNFVATVALRYAVRIYKTNPERFENAPDSERIRKSPVCVFDLCSVDGRAKRIEFDVFSIENALVWTGPKYARSACILSHLLINLLLLLLLSFF